MDSTDLGNYLALNFLQTPLTERTTYPQNKDICGSWGVSQCLSVLLIPLRLCIASQFKEKAENPRVRVPTLIYVEVNQTQVLDQERSFLRFYNNVYLPQKNSKPQSFIIRVVVIVQFGRYKNKQHSKLIMYMNKK